MSNSNQYSQYMLETKCNNVSSYVYSDDECSCGFDEETNAFPSNPVFGQSYVPIQYMDTTFTPSVGLENGTIFPELVSPYSPGQSMEEIAYIARMNSIGEGCNTCK
jgi:hypothetical protein